jgi:copper chaperone NosL
VERRKEIIRLKIVLILVSFVILFGSCTIEESPIVYGKDACHFCKMNIVDKQHAAEIVTNKGKPYKYDAVECMVRDMKERDEKEISLILITDYNSPGKLIDATSAIYLISENLPSPMGANLTGFQNRSDAEKTASEKDGNLYSWDELKGLF